MEVWNVCWNLKLFLNLSASSLLLIVARITLTIFFFCQLQVKYQYIIILKSDECFEIFRVSKNLQYQNKLLFYALIHNDLLTWFSVKIIKLTIKSIVTYGSLAKVSSKLVGKFSNFHSLFHSFSVNFQIFPGTYLI